MKFSIITIFPDLVRNFLGYGLLQKAVQNGLLQVDVHDLRAFSSDKHRKVDDRPFSGGPGMVLMPDPLFRAVESIQAGQQGRVILFSAYGRVLKQKRVKELSALEHLILICGRYEGVDQRAIDALVDEEISLGEYVLMGGEVAAGALLEAVSRMIPGVVGNPESVQADSFYEQDQYTFPQYTQPRSYRGLAVPEVLLSGNHQEIVAWRHKHRKTRRKTNEADR
ncbi:MAG: tRNA (guanosine(37)-N1)-methyltransferase TrmD [Acidobacteria bacterium]|jgi:tRNA (guanine37-N1)-methyltransferase|nr:tRNA (guanosine(37)-N1)-methyltransferase TrmD [Acidobacteriota bacterium]